jgi:hypothetical protein
MIKTRKMKWAEHEAHMAEIGHKYKILIRKPDGKGLLGDLTIDVRILKT